MRNLVKTVPVRRLNCSYVVMEDDGDQPLFQGLLRDGLDLLLERSLYLLVERLDP